MRNYSDLPIEDRPAEEGVAEPTEIDLACKLGLGPPVGPFELMDLVSNALTLQVQEVLLGAYGSASAHRCCSKRWSRPAMMAARLAAAGSVGTTGCTELGQRK